MSATAIPSRQQSNFPVVSDDFVIVPLAIATHVSNTALLAAITAGIAVIAAATSRAYPSVPKAILIGNEGATTVFLRSASGGHAAGAGLPVPAGQSLFMGWKEAPADELRYESAAAFTVAVYF